MRDTRDSNTLVAIVAQVLCRVLTPLPNFFHIAADAGLEAEGRVECQGTISHETQPTPTEPLVGPMGVGRISCQRCRAVGPCVRGRPRQRVRGRQRASTGKNIHESAEFRAGGGVGATAGWNGEAAAYSQQFHRVGAARFRPLPLAQDNVASKIPGAIRSQG